MTTFSTYKVAYLAVFDSVVNVVVRHHICGWMYGSTWMQLYGQIIDFDEMKYYESDDTTVRVISSIILQNRTATPNVY